MSQPSRKSRPRTSSAKPVPRILHYPHGIYLTDGGQLRTLTPAQVTTLRTMLAREATHLTLVD